MRTNPTVSDLCYHFTGWTQKTLAYERMKSILRNKEFKFRRNERKWTINGGYRPKTSVALSNFYVNMICFTETPIEFLREQIESKGGICIAMRKEWLLRSGGQNVIYVDNSYPNDFGRALTELMGRYEAPAIVDNATQELAKTRSNLIHALVAATEDIQLHHEREWRIIRNELNSFITEDYAKFDFTDVAAIWCSTDHVDQLRADLRNHAAFAQIQSLIRSTDDLSKEF